jgi:hypothetical protein
VTPAEQETIHVLGEGGTVLRLGLPLHEAIAERMERGHIVRCNPDGTVPYAPADDQPEPEGQVPAPPLTQPAATASKSEWVGWATVCGALPDDAEAMTKQDLIDKYGKAVS